MVNANLAKPSLLSTYESERRPVAQHVVAIDQFVAGNDLKDEPLMSLIRENQAFTTGFAISYRTGQGHTENLTSPQPGDRAPDFKVVVHATGKKARLYDLWHTKSSWCFHLLILAGDLGHTASRVAEALELYREKDWSWLQIHIITTTTQRAVIESATSTLEQQALLIDKINQAQCHHGYSVKDDDAPVAVVVRPDLHIGYIGTLSSMENYFANFINLEHKGWNV